MVFIAIPWLALELAGSAATSGLVVAITGIPGLIFAPLVGSVIDRFGRKRTAVWVEFLTAFTALLIPFVDWAIGLTIPLLILIGVIRGVVAPGGGTARKSLVPDVAEPAKMTLDRANSIHEAIFAAGFAIGPALATFFIALIGSTSTFYVVALMGFLSAFFANLRRSRRLGYRSLGLRAASQEVQLCRNPQDCDPGNRNIDVSAELLASC